MKDRKALKLTACQEALGPDTTGDSLARSNPLQAHLKYLNNTKSLTARWINSHFLSKRDESSV